MPLLPAGNCGKCGGLLYAIDEYTYCCHGCERRYHPQTPLLSEDGVWADVPQRPAAKRPVGRPRKKKAEGD